MQVPIELILLIVLVFFIREKYYKSKEKLTDFDNGYKQAIHDVCEKWNATNKQTADYEEHCTIIRKYLQRKLDGR